MYYTRKKINAHYTFVQVRYYARADGIHTEHVQFALEWEQTFDINKGKVNYSNGILCFVCLFSWLQMVYLISICHFETPINKMLPH